MYSDYNYIQRQLQENSCLENETSCTSDITIDLSKYCNFNDNLLTEDVCYHWYTHNIYKGNDIYSSSSDAINMLNNVCDEYPYHNKCKCMSEVKNHTDSKFSLGSTYDPSKTYPYYCIFTSCQKDQAKTNPKNPDPYIPNYIYNNTDTPCPTNVCTNILNENLITLNNGSVINIQNICNNQNDKDEKDDKDNSSSASVFDVFADKLGISTTTIYIIITIFFILLLIVIIIIVYNVKSINNKKDLIYKAKIIKKYNNKK